MSGRRALLMRPPAPPPHGAVLMALATFNYVPLLMESGNDFHPREMQQKQA